MHLLLTSTALISFVTAFSPTTVSTIAFRNQHQYQQQHQPLYASSSEEVEEDATDEAISDELAKLIGKRASISSSSSSSTSKDDNTSASAESLYENKSGMDIFDMPELSFKRDTSNDGDEDGAGSGGAGSVTGKNNKEEEVIDYQADYEDENEFHVPNRIGFDTAAWGDMDAGFKAGKKLKKKEIRRGKFLVSDLKQTYKKLMDAGITLAITSEHYGLAARKSSLSSEEILARFTVASKPLLASTMTNPYRSFRKGTGIRLTRLSILQAIEASAERLGVSSIDLYQVPSRTLLLPNVIVDALNTALDQNLIQYVGVSNLSKDSMTRFTKKLTRRGDGEHSLTSNRFEFSLINRKAHKSGLIGACKFLGVVPLAANPLGDGLASGVYTAANPTGGEVVTGKKPPFDFETLEKWSALHNALGVVGVKVKKRMEKENNELKGRRSRYGGNEINSEFSPSQIAINYVVAKGCVPIPSIKNSIEADELIGCLGWGLTDDEIRILDNAADMCDQGL